MIRSCFYKYERAHFPLFKKLILSKSHTTPKKYTQYIKPEYIINNVVNDLKFAHL